MKLARHFAVTFTVSSPIALVSGYIIHAIAFGFVAFMAWRSEKKNVFKIIAVMLLLVMAYILCDERKGLIPTFLGIGVGLSSLAFLFEFWRWRTKSGAGTWFLWMLKLGNYNLSNMLTIQMLIDVILCSIWLFGTFCIFSLTWKERGEYNK